MKSLAFALLTLTSATSLGSDSERIPLARSLIIESCDARGVCNEIESQTSETSAIEIANSSSSKGFESRLHGEDTLQIQEADTPVKSEIFINKMVTGYALYAVLHSGNGHGRHATSTHALISDIHDFKPISLVNRKFKTGQKTYRARLVIAPATKEITN